MKKKTVYLRLMNTLIFLSIFFGASYGYAQGCKLNAATTEAVIYEQKEISQFREVGDTFTAPKKEGYIFGGW